jgi:hypothetical protein
MVVMRGIEKLYKDFRPTGVNHRREQKLALGQGHNSTDG